MHSMLKISRKQCRKYDLVRQKAGTNVEICCLSALLGHTPDIKRASFSSLNKSMLYKPEAEQLISDIHHHKGQPTDLSLKMEKNEKLWWCGKKISVMYIFACG